MASQKNTLLIMAAGLGSRYGGNKQVDRLGPDGEILLQYSIFDAIRSGFKKIVFIIKEEYKPLLESICSAYSDTNVEFEFAIQDFSSVPQSYKIPKDRIKPFGTVHAILCAKDIINEPFAVINADDFYGYQAFELMCKRLSALNDGEGVMVSYKLSNTLSENGSVTRGVCKSENGKLLNVSETYNIRLCSDGSVRGEMDGKDQILDQNLNVSMNMWGFTPEIFENMQVRFHEFLSEIKEGDIKAEYVLPTFVDSQIKSGQLAVSVESTNAKWFGVTYQEDRPKVVALLLKMKQNGEYPEKLKF